MSFLFDVYAELSINGEGEIDICLEDLVNSDEFYTKYYVDGIEGLSSYIFEKYLNDEDLDVDYITLDKLDLEYLFNAYRKEKGEYSERD